MDSGDKVYAITIPSICAALVLMSIVGRGCTVSENAVKKAAIERGCTWLGDGKFACPQNKENS